MKESTLAQFQRIKKRLAKADADILAGRVGKPYSGSKEFLADLHRIAVQLARQSLRRQRVAKCQ